MDLPSFSLQSLASELVFSHVENLFTFGPLEPNDWQSDLFLELPAPDGPQPFVVADAVAAETIFGVSDPETFSKAPA
ncbi:hypothetical protein [Mesorhizobium sp. M0520]|uniref:hypothetical protein n=1 Tax=Mesorhizobium sp. M0520 TaxID=2956957 RepID=UPI0033389F99